MKPEFKIGDRVRYIRPADAGGLAELAGEVGTVRNLNSLYHDSVYVEFDSVPGGVWCKEGSLAHAG